MGTSCSCATCFSSSGATAERDLLAEQDDADDQVNKIVVYERASILGKCDKPNKLPTLLGSKAVSIVKPTFSLLERPKIEDVEDRSSFDLDRYENSTGSMTYRHLSDSGLSTGRHSYYAISSYPVCEALNRYKSRHVIWAPSPTHFAHTSEKSVLPYAEVYGMHPASFDFNRRGQKIDSYGSVIDPDDSSSPNSSIADSDDVSPPHDGRFGRQPDFTKKMGLSPAKVIQVPTAPPGAILYN